MAKNRRNKKRFHKSIWVILGLAVLALVSFFVLHLDFHSKTRYDFISRAKTMYMADSGNYLTPFAKDISVLADVDTPDSEFAPEVGIVAKRDGEIVKFSKNATQKMNPASTTKILTALLALKYGDLEKQITVGSEVYEVESGSSLAGLRPGDTLTMEDLIYGLMLPSGNDAANAIAKAISGSQDAFVDLMNREAHLLGATQSHFANPSGLTDDNHYTTAYDLYLMINEALKYPKFREIVSSNSYTLHYKKANQEDSVKNWKNGNRFLFKEQDKPEGISIVGGKTGTTIAAGSCLVLVYSKGEDEYVSVVLKADNRDALYSNMYNLLEKYSN